MSGRQHTERLGGNILAPPQRRQGVSGRRPPSMARWPRRAKAATSDMGRVVLVQSGVLPSEHAWVVMPDCRVVDFTLEALEVLVADKGLRVDSREALYVGVEVPTAVIVERLDETGWYEPIAELFYADQIQRIADGAQEPPPPPLGRKQPSKQT